MSEEHDSSDNVEFEESEVGPDNEKIGKKRGIFSCSWATNR